MKIYLVGGAVRDRILKKEISDKDYVIIGATESDINKLKEQGFLQLGQRFPVFLHPETKDEYSFARIEKKIGKGYQGFEVETKNVTLEDDLKRRDLTINAIALDEETNQFIDPFGGINDLKNKILKNVSDAFSEDPVRVLRVARFKTRFSDFTIHSDLKNAILEIKKSGELKLLKKSWIEKELEKVFLRDEKPSTFFNTLKELNVLDDIFPNLYNLIGVEQNPTYHPEGDAYIHTMIVLDNIHRMTKDLDCLFACLLHDYGKFLSDNGTGSHINHETLGIPLVEQFCHNYKFSKKRKNFIITFTQEHLRIHKSIEMKASSIVKLLNKLGNNLEKFLMCAKADDLGKNNDNYQQAVLLNKCNKAITNINKKELVVSLKKNNQIHLLEDKYHQQKVSVVKKVLREFKKD